MRRELHILATLGFAVGASALAACSSDNQKPNGADATAGTDAHAPGDAASGGQDGGVDASAGGMDATGGVDATSGMDAAAGGIDATPRGGGTVSVTQSVIHAAMMTFTSYSVSAGFGAPPMGTNACMFTQMGPCLVTHCPAGGSGVTSSALSAGNVTVMGPQLAAPVVLMPDAMNAYMPATGQTRAFNGGDVITVAAVGAAGGVPAFNGMVTAPSDITLTMPVFTLGQPTTINRAADLNLHWTTAAGAPSGNVQVVLVGPTGANMPSDIGFCTFPITSAGGMASVPSAVLNMIPVGTGAISIRVGDLSMVAAGDNDITVNASGSAGTMNNTTAGGQAMYQ